MTPSPDHTDLHRSDPADVLATVHWRRTVFNLYHRVREAADPETGHRLWRAERDRLFAHHPASPLLPGAAATFRGLPVADYDPRWRFRARIEPAPPQSFSVTTGTDGLVGFERLGIVRLADTGTLDVWSHTGYGGGVFVPVKDAGAGSTTYGGGRYLIDTIKGADLGDGDDLVLDLNFAFNPSCAYDPMWACPLAPPGNTLADVVPVGELHLAH
ncbi:DUF1684 domain-containing protein [Brachybacterium halotolerans]|uniref:DUF1684 domain-containing protein n=1 Tax=Brachybacterium halotolerans TaxID=2795215 RepID=UPI001FE70ED3|nr:DUF1684 domain-containing protein [Brachybacterium halotolerans]